MEKPDPRGKSKMIERQEYNLKAGAREGYG